MAGPKANSMTSNVHPDPLLRRLRLRDPHGAPANLDRDFRDAVVVGFIFGAGNWASASAPPKNADSLGKPSSRRPPLYDLAHEFTRLHPHRWKCVYVSLDEKEEEYKAATEGKLWLSMEWNDGSNVGTAKAAEDFLLPGDEDDPVPPFPRPLPPGEKSSSSPPPVARPYSRAVLAHRRDVISVPTLHVYHIPSGTWLSRSPLGVKGQMLERDKRDATWDMWEKGEEAFTGVGEIMLALRWPLAVAMIGLIYLIFFRSDEAFDPLRLGEWLEAGLDTSSRAEL